MLLNKHEGKMTKFRVDIGTYENGWSYDVEAQDLKGCLDKAYQILEENLDNRFDDESYVVQVVCPTSRGKDIVWDYMNGRLE
jgi:hypothetical protein